jgi:hypothetical protein
MKGRTGDPILILGMHRSGTSYLAGLMQAMGVYIGDDLVGPQKGNPRGHFEARPLLEFHQKLIATRDQTQRRAFDDGMLVQQALDTNLTDEETQEARGILKAMRRPGPWGWKEPRTCLFLKSWRELLPKARMAIVYRHPLEVHQSLLRRDHWDLALFPDQAIQAYTVYNRELLENAPDGLYFNANAAFADPEALVALLKDTFGLEGAESVPEFHSSEFQTLQISPALHKLFALIFPVAAGLFEQLQERSGIPWQWQTRDDDDRLEAAAKSLEPLLDSMPLEARMAFVPLLDWWASGNDDGIYLQYEALAREIADHVKKVKQWNEEAAVIYEDNTRLAAESERLGKEFAKQQAFLAKQHATQVKIWGELQRTGASWVEQRDYIDNVLKEKQSLLEELDQLKQKIAAMENKQE